MTMLVGRTIRNTVKVLSATLLLLAVVPGAKAVDPGSIGPDGMITGGTVASGTVSSVDLGVPLTANITTESMETVINYDRFNVWPDWTVNFQQNAGSGAAVLNRVTAACGSEILGTLSSNGQVFIVNPAGIVFGPKAVINMPKLVASGLSMGDELDDYAAFRQLARSPLNDSEVATLVSAGWGGVVEMLWTDNEGVIERPSFTVDQLYLIGTQVENCAQIVGKSTASPYVVMAAATGEVRISKWGQQNIAIEVFAGTPTDPPPLPPCEECTQHHKNTYGKGHTEYQGLGKGHWRHCEDIECYQSLLGAGDIISLAVADSSLIAMVAQNNVSVQADPAGWPANADNGKLGSTGNILTSAGGTTDIYSDITAGGTVVMSAGVDNLVGGNVTADGDVSMTATAGQNQVGGSVGGDNVTMTAGTNNDIALDIQALAGSVSLWAGGENSVGGSVSATGGDVAMTAILGKDDVGGDVTADGDIAMDAGTYIYLGGDVAAGTNATLTAGSGIELDGTGDQSVSAGGKLMILSPITIKTNTGNLFLVGSGNGGSGNDVVDLQSAIRTVEGNIEITGNNGDVQLGGDITAGDLPCEDCDATPLNYGVKILALDGGIYTAESDGINVTITGGSDQGDLRGVDLGETTQKAAIILISRDNLVLGENGQLIATGKYYADGSVDDRAAINFRYLPPSPDEAHHQGVPIDIAVYVQSLTGDVTLDHLGILSVTRLGTAVLDAWNNVKLTNTTSVGETGPCNDPYFLYRLEVCSRTTPTLAEAIAGKTLPLADDRHAMELLMGFTDEAATIYILRGGTDEDPESSLYPGSWTLDPEPPTPGVTAQLPAMVSPVLGEGCPALLLAAAEELGQDPALFMSGTFVSSKSTQPCDTCERLMSSANILKDTEGTRLAALGQVLNEFVTTPAPLSPEQMAAVTQTLAMHANDGTAYAAAGEWLDALATYVGIVKSEIGLTEADALAIATARYGTPENANDAVKAFIAQRLAEMAG